MKAHLRKLSIAIFLAFSLTLLAGCDSLGFGSEGGSGGGENGDGALDPIDLSDNGDSGGENGELDEIDLSITCPVSPVYFDLTFDYLLEYNDPNGFIREKTDPAAGITIIVDSEDAYQAFRDAQAQTIPGSIEGQIGDCQVDGMFEFSFLIIGDCDQGMVTLDITGTYEIYQRMITCNGQVAENFTDSLVDGPGALIDFKISTAGDTFATSLDLGIAKLEYTWSLTPQMGANPIGE